MLSTSELVNSVGSTNLNSLPAYKMLKEIESRFALLHSIRDDLVEFGRFSGDLLSKWHDDIALVSEFREGLDLHNVVISKPSGFTRWKAFLRSNSAKSVRESYGIPEQKAEFMDYASRMGVLAQCHGRASKLLQRIKNAIRYYSTQPNEYGGEGWFLVFDTLTFDTDSLN
ncbi:hypothetical protein, partial [Vibrio splendidus]